MNSGTRARADLEFGILVGMVVGAIMGGVAVWVIWMVSA